MDLFKLIFEHDLLLENLSGNEDARARSRQQVSFEDFMKPVPTYVKYYFSGSRLEENLFGLSVLKKFDAVLQGIDRALQPAAFFTGNGRKLNTLSVALQENTSVVVAGEKLPAIEPAKLETGSRTGTRERLPEITGLLDEGLRIIYREPAHNGYDLHLFSRDNLFDPLYQALRPLVAGDFRYFSINGKRMSSERMFYFETWTLEKPPHGFEEVTKSSAPGL